MRAETGSTTNRAESAAAAGTWSSPSYSGSTVAAAAAEDSSSGRPRSGRQVGGKGRCTGASSLGEDLLLRRRQRQDVGMGAPGVETMCDGQAEARAHEMELEEVVERGCCACVEREAKA